MNDAGYTLVETLTAMAVLALAIGGLSAGLQVLARQQSGVGRVVGDSQAMRNAQAGLDRLFEGRGPYRSHQPQQFSGDARGFTFDCGQAQACSAALVEEGGGVSMAIRDGGAAGRLPLRVPGPARFTYQGARGVSETWPPAGPRQALRVVAVVREPDSATLIKTRLWIEQPLRCDFDVVLQDCR